MPDVYATITEADPAVVTRLVDAMEIRAAEPQQRAMLEAYLADVPFDRSRVLEIGCGSGPVSRVLADWPGVAEVVGVDPSPIFLARASRQDTVPANLSFREADGRALPFADGDFDAVVCHTVLCHVPGPEQILAEARRVLRPGGWLAIFDGDYATTTVAIAECDPLQVCVDAAMGALVHDRWLIRRLSPLVVSAGFEVRTFRSHGYVQTAEPSYMLTLVERGADVLVNSGRIGAASGAALKEEAVRRVAEGLFFGHIAYASLTATKPVFQPRRIAPVPITGTTVPL